MSQNRNEAHTALIRAALEQLAIHGYCAWPNQTGVWFDEKTGRPHKFGKPGSGDIFIILPPNGRHVEAEGKTGTGRQSDKQKKHQEFIVERNGGIYILFRSPDELLQKLKSI